MIKINVVVLITAIAMLFGSCQEETIAVRDVDIETSEILSFESQMAFESKLVEVQDYLTSNEQQINEGENSLTLDELINSLNKFQDFVTTVQDEKFQLYNELKSELGLNNFTSMLDIYYSLINEKNPNAFQVMLNEHSGIMNIDQKGIVDLAVSDLALAALLNVNGEVKISKKTVNLLNKIENYKGKKDDNVKTLFEAKKHDMYFHNGVPVFLIRLRAIKDNNVLWKVRWGAELRSYVWFNNTWLPWDFNFLSMDAHITTYSYDTDDNALFGNRFKDYSFIAKDYVVQKLLERDFENSPFHYDFYSMEGSYEFKVEQFSPKIERFMSQWDTDRVFNF